MHEQSPVVAIIPDEASRDFVQQVANSIGYPEAHIIMGTPKYASTQLGGRSHSPRYLVIDIGAMDSEALAEIDMLAEQCEVGTRVVVLGNTNDVSFYRELRARGVIEYFTKPAKVADVQAALLTALEAGGQEQGIVIACMSAASGDGASTVALNMAYAIARDSKKPVVLVDMDYQFGMVAKNLDLATSYGIKELFEHPERGMDATLVGRMIASYGNSGLNIIAAPNQLYPLPDIPPAMIQGFISLLRRNYDVVVLDLPHIWTPWVAAVLEQSNHAIMVAQMWLRSVTHSARLLTAWRQAGVPNQRICLVINRSGARFKEAVNQRDFERVCGMPLSYFFANDIKSVVAAENQGKTTHETGDSLLSKQFTEFASFFVEGAPLKIEDAHTPATPAATSGKFSLFRTQK